MTNNKALAWVFLETIYLNPSLLIPYYNKLNSIKKIQEIGEIDTYFDLNANVPIDSENESDFILFYVP